MNRRPTVAPGGSSNVVVRDHWGDLTSILWALLCKIINPRWRISKWCSWVWNTALSREGVNARTDALMVNESTGLSRRCSKVQRNCGSKGGRGWWTLVFGRRRFLIVKGWWLFAGRTLGVEEWIIGSWRWLWPFFFFSFFNIIIKKYFNLKHNCTILISSI